MSATREQVEEMKDELEAAKKLLDREEWLQARPKYTSLLERAVSLGIESSYLCWGLSLAHERLGDVEEAFRYASEAVVADPMHPTLCYRFTEAAEAMRKRLELSSKKNDDEHLPGRIYAALMRAGETDAQCHLAMARAHLARGQLDAAWTLLESTTLLEPAGVEAWRLLAEVARRRGDAVFAEESEARARALEGQSAPFGIPAPLSSC